MNGAAAEREGKNPTDFEFFCLKIDQAKAMFWP